MVKGGNKENLPNIRNIIRLTDLLGKGNNKEIEFLSFDVHDKYKPRRPCINITMLCSFQLLFNLYYDINLTVN